MGFCFNNLIIIGEKFMKELIGNSILMKAISLEFGVRDLDVNFDYKRLDEVKELYISNYRNRRKKELSLDGIQYLKNLKRLTVIGYKISDLSDLGLLKKLNSFTYDTESLDELRIIYGMKSLKVVNCSWSYSMDFLSHFEVQCQVPYAWMLSEYFRALKLTKKQMKAAELIVFNTSEKSIINGLKLTSKLYGLCKAYVGCIGYDDEWLKEQFGAILSSIKTKVYHKTYHQYFNRDFNNEIIQYVNKETKKKIFSRMLTG
jgi:hypothetical protein